MTTFDTHLQVLLPVELLFKVCLERQHASRLDGDKYIKQLHNYVVALWPSASTGSDGAYRTRLAVRKSSGPNDPYEDAPSSEEVVSGAPTILTGYGGKREDIFPMGTFPWDIRVASTSEEGQLPQSRVSQSLVIPNVSGLSTPF